MILGAKFHQNGKTYINSIIVRQVRRDIDYFSVANASIREAYCNDTKLRSIIQYAGI